MNRSIVFFILISIFLSMCTNTVGKNKENLELEYIAATNKIVVLNFWSIFCSPCMKELPALSSVCEVNKNSKNVSVMSIALNSQYELDQFFSCDTTNLLGKLGHSLNANLKFNVIASFKYDHIWNHATQGIRINPKNDTILTTITSRYKLIGIPTTIIYFKNREYRRFVGFSGDASKYYKELSSVIDSLKMKI